MYDYANTNHPFLKSRELIMNEHAKRIQKPRCFLLYALAPSDLPAAEANRILNAFIGDPALPLAIFHDHFIGQPGGIVIFYVKTTAERDALLSQTYLDGWQVEIQPLIFSYSPSAFDEQTTFTLKAYRGVDWEALQKDKRPAYGNPSREAETAEEE
jgi:hypothetical protein